MLRLRGVNTVRLHWQRQLLLRRGGGRLRDHRLGLWDGLGCRLGCDNRSRRGRRFANRLVNGFGFGGGGDRRRHLGLRCSCRDRAGVGGVGGLTGIVRLDSLLLEETENVVKDKVSVGLFGKEEGLDKLAPWLGVVGHFTDDLNDDATVGRGLSIDRVDENFAIFETDGRDFVVDFLKNY